MTSYWKENKESFINKALTDYKETDSINAGYNILRYTDMGLLAVKSEYQELSTEELETCPYAMLRLAKIGAIEWNGA